MAAKADNDNLLADRIQRLNTITESDGKCVVYVMSRDQRADDNHALLAAQADALRRKLPLAVVFCLYRSSGFRSREQFEWMLEGLGRTEAALKQKNIPFICVIGKPLQVLPTVINKFEAAAVYLDFNPLRGPRTVAQRLAATLSLPVYWVDTHNIVPCWVASPKLEVGARTLRPKINAVLHQYLQEPPVLETHSYQWPGSYMDIAGLDAHIQELLSKIPRNGTRYTLPEPNEALDNFLRRAHAYEADRNDPVANAQSHLSPYLHFGQLSSLRIVLDLMKTVSPDAVAAFIEEIIVRKELSDNYCYYNPQYDALDGAPQWAQLSLQKHAGDPREFTYTLTQLESAQTHDPAWNAAQLQMMRTGTMHGYMRMYWAKKILEWSPSESRAEVLNDSHPYKTKLEPMLSGTSGAAWAFAVLGYLNDFYSIDGGDPNGYAGISWSVAGTHDRPWVERSIFGSVRYMNYNGLKRKFAIAEYENRWK